MEQVDVALIVALDEEYQTIRRTIGITPSESADRVHIFEVPNSAEHGCSLKMAVHVTGEMGLVPTASATDMVIERYSPKLLISIGLSGQLSSSSMSCVIATSLSRSSM